MKPDEVRNLSADEVDAKSDTLRKELFQLRMQARVGKLEKSSQLRTLRRDLARLLTIRREWSAQKTK